MRYRLWNVLGRFDRAAGVGSFDPFAFVVLGVVLSLLAGGGCVEVLLVAMLGCEGFGVVFVEEGLVVATRRARNLGTNSGWCSGGSWRYGRKMGKCNRDVIGQRSDRDWEG